MLMLRFQRVGRRNDPAYRIVVVPKRSKPQASGLEVVGAFHPKTKETRLARERIQWWIAHGARTSSRVHNLLVRNGVIRSKKIAVANRAR